MASTEMAISPSEIQRGSYDSPMVLQEVRAQTEFEPWFSNSEFSVPSTTSLSSLWSFILSPSFYSLGPGRKKWMGFPVPRALPSTHTRSPVPLPLEFPILLTFCSTITIFHSRLYFLPPQDSSGSSQLFTSSQIEEEPKWNINYQIKVPSSNAAWICSTWEFQSMLITSFWSLIECNRHIFLPAIGSMLLLWQIQLEGKGGSTKWALQ